MSSTETRDRLLFRLFLVGTGRRVTSETGHTKASANPTGDQIHASFLSPQRLADDLRNACGRTVSLPAVDAYAQSRRLHPVLRASETAAPPASVQKLRLLGLCLFPVIRHSSTERETPGIEEQHNKLRLTRITQNRGQRSEVRRKPKPGSGERVRSMRTPSPFFSSLRF